MHIHAQRFMHQLPGQSFKPASAALTNDLEYLFRRGSEKRERRKPKTGARPGTAQKQSQWRRNTHHTHTRAKTKTGNKHENDNTCETEFEGQSRHEAAGSGMFFEDKAAVKHAWAVPLWVHGALEQPFTAL